MSAASNMVVNDPQVEFFKENGYLVVPDVYSSKEVDRLRRDAADLARGKYPGEGIKPLPSTMTDDEVLQGILAIHQPHFISPVILEFVKHPVIAGVLSRIIGPSVKCMQSMLFVKPPGAQGQAWHQDENFIPTRDRSLCGGWVALDDATVDNGCLWVLAGSHKRGYLYPLRPHGEPDEFDFAPEAYGFDDSAEVPVEVKVGTAVFFNGYLLHRSRKNRSTIYRRALVNHYMNAYSLLPWEVKEGETVATADRRTVVMVAGEDPYSWKGYDEPPRDAVWLRTEEEGARRLKLLQK